MQKRSSEKYDSYLLGKCLASLTFARSNGFFRRTMEPIYADHYRVCFCDCWGHKVGTLPRQRSVPRVDECVNWTFRKDAKKKQMRQITWVINGNCNRSRLAPSRADARNFREKAQISRASCVSQSSKNINNQLPFCRLLFIDLLQNFNGFFLHTVEGI